LSLQRKPEFSENNYLLDAPVLLHGTGYNGMTVRKADWIPAILVTICEAL